MLRIGLILLIVWAAALVVRLLLRASLGTGRGTGPWRQGPWSRGGGPSSDHGQESQSAYEVLRVRPGASWEEITTAYRLLVQQYHPDKVANLASEFREVAERRMKEINAAYEELRRRNRG